MKFTKVLGLFIVILAFAGASACSRDYQVDAVITGIVEEKRSEEGLLVMKEYGGEDEGRRPGNFYEIPVTDIDQYEIGEKLEITILSNTDTDVWNLDNMKFEIERIED